MNADEIKAAIEARLDELRPLIAEHDRLMGAVAALAAIPQAKPRKARIEAVDLDEPVVHAGGGGSGVNLANTQRAVPITAKGITRSGNRARGNGPEKKRTKRRYAKGEKKAAVQKARRTSIEESSRTYGIPVSTVRSWVRTSA